MIRFLLIPLILCLTLLPSYSALKGGVDYKIPFDYTKLNQQELESKAEFYYTQALKSKTVDENMTYALNLYTLLSNAYPNNIIYPLRLGKLYDVIGKDRYAKGMYFRAAAINSSSPEPYFYLGDFYYDRERWQKALKYYQKAFDKGYSNNYQTLEKIGLIYQKFGDTENALHYLQCASALNPNENLDKIIMTVKNSDNTNKEYYRK